MSDWVYSELSEAIRSLEFPPGMKLSEPSLAARLEVSRAPVREAIGRLADQRLVTVVPQSGTRVAPILMNEVENACFIRSSLESGALRQAIERPSTRTDDLRRILEANRASFEGGLADEFFATDEQLHQTVFALAGVPEVWGVVRGVKVHLDRLRHLHMPHALASPDIIDEHEMIIDALESGDARAGEEVIHRHAYRIIADSEYIRDEHPEYFQV
jgi:DNA-binding GntR family transcriptional regulator